MPNVTKKSLISTIALILAAAFCVLFLSGILSDPAKYAPLYASIDAKAEDVLALTAASALASTAITALPDDVGTPIANQIAEFTDYLLIVLSILMAEKYLLSILGLCVFRFLVPAALIAAVPLFSRFLPGVREVLKKAAVLSLALYFVIPVSMCISDKVEDTFQISVNSVVESVN